MSLRFPPASVALALALALGAAAAQAADKPPEIRIERAKEIIDDASITGAIKAELARDKTVSALNLNVDTRKGVVRLSGTARSREEAERAVAIAKGAAGVASVKNDIQVRR